MDDDNVYYFENKRIRTVWNKDEQEWYLSVSDVVGSLTDSADVKQYIKKMRNRDSELDSRWGTICTPTEMIAADGKKYLTTAANTEGILRIIQSVQSPNIEPFKLWLKSTFGRDASIDISTAKEEYTKISKGRQLTGLDSDFDEIITIVDHARETTFRLVNRELISMYWNIGKYISGKLKDGKWGKSVVEDFTRYVQNKRPDIKGFSASNVWRMRQFYETYCDNEKLAPLVREITWTNNLLIMSRTKSDDAREFYLTKAREDNYSKHELEHQLDRMLFERTVLSYEKNKPFISKNTDLAAIRDSYVFDHLDIPTGYGEKDLRRAIVANIRGFILEFGKDFAFVGEEYRIQVGNKDFHIDLLFYNRRLSCLVAVELKSDEFRPEYLGQLEFYLEALDRNVRKPGENPSVGLILCAGKNDTVVEYSLSRSMSPALVADYQLCLPDKSLLENRLRELKDLRDLEEHEGDDMK